MEWGLPVGMRHMRARKRLHALRERLERDLHTLAGVVTPPPAMRAGPADVREPVGLAVVIEERGDVRARVDRLRERVARRTDTLVAAGRSRGWCAPTGNGETAVFLAGEGLAAAGRVVGGLLRGGAWMLGLTAGGGEQAAAAGPGAAGGAQARRGGPGGAGNVAGAG